MHSCYNYKLLSIFPIAIDGHILVYWCFTGNISALSVRRTDVKFSILSSSVVDRGFYFESGRTFVSAASSLRMKTSRLITKTNNLGVWIMHSSELALQKYN